MLQKLISPQVALESMMQLAIGLQRLPPAASAPLRLARSHVVESLPRRDCEARADEEPSEHQRRRDEQLVRAANQKADVARARRDARAYKLNEFFRTTTVPKGYPL